MANLGNPITSINGYSLAGIPYELVMGRYDVSSSDAGRDEAGEMHKEMIGKSVKYQLKFRNIRTSVIQNICQAVESAEYITAVVIDPVEGSPGNGYKVTRTYYAGDRSMSLYSAALDVWGEFSFDLIERGVH